VSEFSGHARRGRALHPPLTHFPIAAYVFAAAFDVASAVGGPHRGWATQLWHAGTFVLVGGLCVCLLTMLTGFLDLIGFPGQHPGASRTVVSHVTVMSAVFMIGSADTAWRIAEYRSQASTPVAILACSVAAAAGVCVGASYGGTLVFRYGVGVRVTAAAPGGDQAAVSRRGGARGRPASAWSGRPAGLRRRSGRSAPR
jgi:uncharacterized membrane protein